jgi:hypothetical protein
LPSEISKGFELVGFNHSLEDSWLTLGFYLQNELTYEQMNAPGNNWNFGLELYSNEFTSEDTYLTKLGWSKTAAPYNHFGATKLISGQLLERLKGSKKLIGYVYGYTDSDKVIKPAPEGLKDNVLVLNTATSISLRGKYITPYYYKILQIQVLDTSLNLEEKKKNNLVTYTNNQGETKTLVVD